MLKKLETITYINMNWDKDKKRCGNTAFKFLPIQIINKFKMLSNDIVSDFEKEERNQFPI